MAAPQENSNKKTVLDPSAAQRLIQGLLQALLDEQAADAVTGPIDSAVPQADAARPRGPEGRA